MTARIDHEAEANQAAAAGKYDIAQYHATMRLAEAMEAMMPMRVMFGADPKAAEHWAGQVGIPGRIYSPEADAAALRTMMRGDS